MLTIFAFIFALAILIAFHEFGHFIVARWNGIRVIRFSIGFGKVIYSRQKTPDDTEYAIAAIPLGGYVKMLDEREMEVRDEDKPYSFNSKTVWQRIAVVAAGPVFNFILAIVLLWFMYLYGITGISPIVGEIDKGSIAEQANLQAEDRFVAVNGKKVQTWSNVQMALLNASLQNNGIVHVQVMDKFANLQDKTLDLSDVALLQEEGDILKKLGLNMWMPDIEPIIAGVVEGGAAAQAGLKKGDILLQADGKAIKSWQDWVKLIRQSANKPLSILVERDGFQKELILKPGVKEVNGEKIGYIGAYQKHSKALLERFYTTEQYGVADSFVHAVDKTWNMSVLTIKLIGKLITGDATIKNISGPISIAQYAGQSASLGLAHYLYFMALISLSLGVLNLLPIPVLDGGHLLFYFIEAIKGSPVSETVQIIGQNIGLALLGLLMAVAFYNDILRVMQ